MRRAVILLLAAALSLCLLAGANAAIAPAWETAELELETLAGTPEAASIPLRHLKPEEIGLLDALKLKNPAIFSYMLRFNSLTEAQQDSIHEYIAQFFHVEEDT